jgi:hypothetical protein
LYTGSKAMDPNDEQSGRNCLLTSDYTN